MSASACMQMVRRSMPSVVSLLSDSFGRPYLDFSHLALAALALRALVGRATNSDHSGCGRRRRRKRNRQLERQGDTLRCWLACLHGSSNLELCKLLAVRYIHLVLSICAITILRKQLIGPVGSHQQDCAQEHKGHGSRKDSRRLHHLGCDCTDTSQPHNQRTSCITLLACCG